LRALFYDAMSNGGAEDDADGEIGESVIDKVSDYLEREKTRNESATTST
jgi:hypothetical protein